MKRPIIALTGAALLLGGLATASAAESTTHVVTGNTVEESAGENASPGWWFGRDPGNQTPYEFTLDQSSTGEGSLYVPPISGDSPSDKFIAENFVWQPIDELDSISVDYLQGPDTTADNFYLNVYANIDDDRTNYFDCRFDYVATGAGDGWQTLTTGVPSDVDKRGDRLDGPCPATLAEMPPGSHVRMFSVNVGDTGASDAGASGYLDNVVITTTTEDEGTSTTAYDFESDADGDGVPDTAPPTSKDQCKQGGYADFNNPSFRNQGQCGSYVATQQ